MYKQFGKFTNRLGGKAASGRFAPKLTTSSDVGRKDLKRVAPAGWRALAARLDAEVARVTPSLANRRQRPDPVSVKKPRVSKPRAGKRVYLVRFELICDPTERFLKVGVSAMDIRARFRPDAKRYRTEIIAESERFPPRDALCLEQAIHSALLAKRYRPRVPLISGNTECYVHTEENLKRFLEIVRVV